jgi:hypothetical protein
MVRNGDVESHEAPLWLALRRSVVGAEREDFEDLDFRTPELTAISRSCQKNVCRKMMRFIYVGFLRIQYLFHQVLQ